MFSQVFVCSHGGVGFPACITGHMTTGRRGSASKEGRGSLHPRAGGLCPGGLHPGWIRQTPPPPDTCDTTGYGQQVGGMHPTAMHSCLARFLPKTAWKWKKLDREGGVHSAPLDPPMARSIWQMTAPDRCFYWLNQASLTMFIAGLKRGKTNRSQTATDVVMVIT